MAIISEKVLKQILDEIVIGNHDSKGYQLAKGDLEAIKNEIFRKYGGSNPKDKIQEDGQIFTPEELSDYLNRHHGVKINRIEPGKKSGFLTFLTGFVNPMKGFPDAKPTRSITLMKRIIPLVFETIYHSIKQFVPKDPIEYSRSVREIYRIFSLMIIRERDDDMKIKWSQMRDIICMILEKDLAYRLRFQDILSELNLEEIKLDEGDQEYALKNKSYNWGFIK